jgi:hypothetical protein
MENPAPVRWPTKNQRTCLWALLIAAIIFAGVVEYRSVFLKRRMTDADVYFRTAWAVRTGLDIYDVADTNGWHYQYPPFLAVLMVPVANPPPLADRAGMLPYGVSIAVWFTFSVVCLAFGIHWLASAIEPDLVKSLSQSFLGGCANWWALRIVPFLVCLPSIGRTLSRGQINLMVLMLFCAATALLTAKRRALAGICLGAAISIKLIPGFLLLYGIWRRDWRFLAGSLGGVLLCGIMVPMLAMGPGRTVDAYRKYCTVLLSPALAGGSDKSRTEELLNANGTDSQAFKVIIHNTLHASLPREKRPSEVQPWVSVAHWILAALFTATTLWFARKPRHGDVIYNVLFIGCLLAIMIPTSPVSHTHYFVYLLPLVMALTAHAWEKNHATHLGRGYSALYAIHILMNVICLPVSLLLLKDLGISLYGGLILWAAGIHALWERSKMPYES